MHPRFPARSQLLVTLPFAGTLAVLGFQVASWWGVLAGLLVGSVMAARLLMRGAVEAQPAAVILAAPGASRAPKGVVVPERPLLH